MNKNTIGFILILLVIFNLYTVSLRKSDTLSPLQSPVTQPIISELTHDQILDRIKVQDIRAHVERLSSKEFAGRATGTEGNDKAAAYIKAHLDKFNIPYKEQEFSVQNKKTKNIIGYIHPNKPIDNKIIVIGAHFDHLGTSGSNYYPGADDNASGVASLMGIAAALTVCRDKLKHTISLQFYSAEELGLIGSKYYVNNPLLPENQPDIDKHIAMINLDMIGYLKQAYQQKENCTEWKSDKDWRVFDRSSSVDIQTIVEQLTNKYSFARNISGYRPGGSDHAPFYNKGIPVVFLHTGLHRNYHKVSDTANKLNYAGITSISKLAVDIALSIY